MTGTRLTVSDKINQEMQPRITVGKIQLLVSHVLR